MKEAIGTENRIKKARQLRGLTQKQLGEKIGCTSAFVSMVEGGKRSASPEQIAVLASALGV